MAKKHTRLYERGELSLSITARKGCTVPADIGAPLAGSMASGQAFGEWVLHLNGKTGGNGHWISVKPLGGSGIIQCRVRSEGGVRAGVLFPKHPANASSIGFVHALLLAESRKPGGGRRK